MIIFLCTGLYRFAAAHLVSIDIIYMAMQSCSSHYVIMWSGAIYTFCIIIKMLGNDETLPCLTAVSLTKPHPLVASTKISRN